MSIPSPSGDSTRMTLAPMEPRRLAAQGPTAALPKSRTLIVGVVDGVGHAISALEGLLLEHTVALRRLHADDVGSHGAQETRGPGAYGGPAEIEDVDAVKETVHVIPPVSAHLYGE